MDNQNSRNIADTHNVKESEKKFHNERFSAETDPREKLDKWYLALDKCYETQNQLIKDNGKNKIILEYGCSTGEFACDIIDVPKFAKEYVGIDISDVAIDKANKRLTDNEKSYCKFLVMDAENMSFENNYFDLVFGRGIIHHLDLEKSFSEISRILKTGGIAIFMEPLGHNWILNKFRQKTPELRTPDEHPLLFRDFKLCRKYFSSVEIKLYGLVSLASVFFVNTPFFNFIKKILQSIDTIVLSIPYIKRNAWMSVIILKK